MGSSTSRIFHQVGKPPQPLDVAVYFMVCTSTNTITDFLDLSTHPYLADTLNEPGAITVAVAQINSFG
jgi:hypothetical protein